jgi:hypothetical protein
MIHVTRIRLSGWFFALKWTGHDSVQADDTELPEHAFDNLCLVEVGSLSLIGHGFTSRNCLLPSRNSLSWAMRFEPQPIIVGRDIEGDDVNVPTS